ncbi:hypothetical protein A4X20_01570 [Mycolicibacterium iranicum]|uniref:Uncharacterized protein n=1 Tax=Mycolicibacterium iranicum TaxID=912594 RepID=A0A178M3B4_MYCIR|nr:hypothetical protein A4X20_01570 [Mycolicibacterium iranicum]
MVTECLLGTITCSTANPGPGVMLLLQPCTVDRVPLASVRWIGPVCDEADADEICSWIAAGEWDVTTLSPQLRADVNLVRSSRLN